MTFSALNAPFFDMTFHIMHGLRAVASPMAAGFPPTMKMHIK
jgi:hypothetical protein